jgi:hypothetical protein
MSKNFPNKEVADRLDLLIGLVEQGSVFGVPEDGGQYVRRNKGWEKLDYEYAENKPAINGKELDKDSTAAGIGLETVADAGSNGNLLTQEQGTLVGAINEIYSDKADKITYPEIPYNDDLDIDTPRVIQCNTAQYPELDVGGVGGIGYVAWQVLGHSNWLFGIWKDTVNGDDKTRVGLFQRNGDICTEIESMYDGTQWLDLFGKGTGAWFIRYGIHATIQRTGTLKGFDTSTDITIPALPTENLEDVASRKQDKIPTVLGEKDVVIAEADGGIDGTTYKLSEVLDTSKYKIPSNKAVSDALAAETIARQAYDAEQDLKIQTLNGQFYPLDPYDFGKTLDVTNQGDVSLINTYAITMTPNASATSDIRDGTVVKNLFDGVEFVWNAVSQTWLDWGIGNIVTAGNDHLGVVIGTAEPGDGSKDGAVTVLPGGKMEVLGFDTVKTQVSTLASGKVDKETGKGLSTNDFTNDYLQLLQATSGALKVFHDELTYSADKYEDILVTRYMFCSDLSATNSFMEIIFDGISLKVVATSTSNLRTEVKSAIPGTVVTATIRRNTFYNSAVEGQTIQNSELNDTAYIIDSTIYVNGNDYSIYQIFVGGHWWEINLWPANEKSVVLMSVERRL